MANRGAKSWRVLYHRGALLQFCHMGNTLTVRLPEEMMARLRAKARRSGLPMSRMVRQSLEAALESDVNQTWRKYAGIIKGGPPGRVYPHRIFAQMKLRCVTILSYG